MLTEYVAPIYDVDMTNIQDLIPGKIYHFKDDTGCLYCITNSDSNISHTFKLKSTDLFMYVGSTNTLMKLLKHQNYRQDVCIFLFKEEYCTHDLSASRQKLGMES